MRKSIMVVILVSLLCFSCTDSDDSDTNNGTDQEPVEKDFFVWDLSVMPPVVKVVTATLRAEGDYCYIFVDNEEWNVSVTQAQSKELVTWFDEKTPEGSINPNQGIYDNDVEIFGDPPDTFDNDPKIYLLLTELASYAGYQFDGYFNIFDQMSDAQAQQYGERSNEIEILYINSVIRPVNDDGTLSVIAHEFVHLIQSNYDSDELWLEEALAELGMLINGYYTDSAWVKSFLSNPNYSLVGESEHTINYGASLLWALYLYEQVDEATFFQQLMIEQLDGLQGIDTVLSLFGFGPVQDYFLNWLGANYLDDPGMANGEYGYTMIDIPSPNTTEISTYPATHSVDIHRYGADYLNLESLAYDTVSITVQTEDYEDIFLGILDMNDSANGTLEYHPLTAGSTTIIFYGDLTELSLIITSVSDQTEITVDVSLDNY